MCSPAAIPAACSLSITALRLAKPCGIGRRDWAGSRRSGTSCRRGSRSGSCPGCLASAIQSSTLSSVMSSKLNRYEPWLIGWSKAHGPAERRMRQAPGRAGDDLLQHVAQLACRAGHDGHRRAGEAERGIAGRPQPARRPRAARPRWSCRFKASAQAANGSSGVPLSVSGTSTNTNSSTSSPVSETTSQTRCRGRATRPEHCVHAGLAEPTSHWLSTTDSDVAGSSSLALRHPGAAARPPPPRNCAALPIDHSTTRASLLTASRKCWSRDTHDLGRRRDGGTADHPDQQGSGGPADSGQLIGNPPAC